MPVATMQRERFDVEALRRRAGAKVFARGLDYCNADQVEILAIEDGRALARVHGGEEYRTVVRQAGERIDGSCTCMAYEDAGICKHIVALALMANALPDGSDVAGAFSRIRKHLQAKGVDALVKMVMELAERDTALFRQLEMSAVEVHATDATLETRLRKAIERATRVPEYLDHDDEEPWAAGALAAVESVAGLLESGRADLALTLVDFAIDRLDAAFEQIGSEGMDCEDLARRCHEIHLAAVSVVRPEPMALARLLFTRELQSIVPSQGKAFEDYAEVLGNPGLAEYRRLVMAECEKPLSSGNTRLIRMLDGLAAHDGDTDRRIALRAMDLQSTSQYLNVAQFCFEQNRPDQALLYAEAGLRACTDRYRDRRLLEFTVGLLEKAGRVADAVVLLRQAFEKEPGGELYRLLKRVGGEEAGAWALDCLHAQVAKARPSRWYSPANLLVEILTEEKAFAAAWTVVAAHGADDPVKMTLAQASDTTFPREALSVFGTHVDRLVERGGNPAYAEAAAVVARMAALRSPAEHKAYLAALRLRFSRRRNFMALLD